MLVFISRVMNIGRDLLNSNFVRSLRRYIRIARLHRQLSPTNYLKLIRDRASRLTFYHRRRIASNNDTGSHDTSDSDVSARLDAETSGKAFRESSKGRHEGESNRSRRTKETPPSAGVASNLPGFLTARRSSAVAPVDLSGSKTRESSE